MATPLETLQKANEEQASRRKRPAKAIKRPDDVERYYRAQLESLVRAMRREVDRWVVPAIKRSKADYTADAWDDDAESGLEAAAAPFYGPAVEATYRRIASEMVNRVARQTTESLVKSVNQSVGVNLAPIFEQQDMADFIDANIKNNVSLIESVRDEYLKSVRTAVYQGMVERDSPTNIIDSIQKQTGVSRRRARLLARDQTGRISSQVTERRQQGAGIEYYQSIDAGDERVSGKPGGRYPNARISCWGIARRDIGYGKGVYRMDAGASWAGETGLHPGRHHPLCLPAGVRVAASEIEATTKRWFEGNLVTILTASGKELAATPNHPVLTRHGWVAISELTESDHVISASGVDVESGLYPDDKDVVSRVEEIAASLFVARGVLPVKMEVSPEDFHGDGTDGDICVMHADGLLNGEINTFFSEGVDKKLLERAFDRLIAFFGLRRLNPSTNRNGSPQRGGMRFFDLAGSLIGRHLGPFERFGGRLTAPIYSVLAKGSLHHVAANPETLSGGVLGAAGEVHGDDVLFGESECAEAVDTYPLPLKDSPNHLGGNAEISSQIRQCAPGGVFLDEVVSVVVNDFAGHVYNLQTASGAYLAEGILTHNCRCVSKPVFKWEIDGE